MRSLKSQTIWCERAQWVLGGGMVAMVGFFYLAGYRPCQAHLAERLDQISQKQHDLDANQSKARNLPVVALEVEKLRQRLDRYNKKLPHQPDLGAFIKDITQLSQRSSLKRMDVRPGLTRRSELYNELPISLVFEGDFISIFGFLQHAEDMERLTRVRGLSVKSRDPAGGQVEVQLFMNIYYSEG